MGLFSSVDNNGLKINRLDLVYLSNDRICMVYCILHIVWLWCTWALGQSVLQTVCLVTSELFSSLFTAAEHALTPPAYRTVSSLSITMIQSLNILIDIDYNFCVQRIDKYDVYLGIYYAGSVKKRNLSSRSHLIWWNWNIEACSIELIWSNLEHTCSHSNYNNYDVTRQECGYFHECTTTRDIIKPFFLFCEALATW